MCTVSIGTPVSKRSKTVSLTFTVRRIVTSSGTSCKEDSATPSIEEQTDTPVSTQVFTQGGTITLDFPDGASNVMIGPGYGGPVLARRSIPPCVKDLQFLMEGHIPGFDAETISGVENLFVCKLTPSMHVPTCG